MGFQMLQKELTKTFVMISNWKKTWSLLVHIKIFQSFNPFIAKLFNWNFHPLKVVFCWRDPQLQVSENWSDLTKWRSTLFKSCWLMSHVIFNIFKHVKRWYLMCYIYNKMKTRIYSAPVVKGLRVKSKRLALFANKYRRAKTPIIITIPKVFVSL